MAADAEHCPVRCGAPVKEQYLPAHGGAAIDEGYFRIEIQYAGRINQGWDKHERRTVTAAVAQYRAGDPASDRPLLGAQRSRRILVSSEAVEGVARQLRLALGRGAHQRQKQRQGTRGVFMLQRTIFR